MNHASLRCLLVTACLLVSVGACRDDGGPAVVAAPAEPAVEPAGQWVTLLARQMETRSRRPEPFTATSQRLRVITSMGPNLTPHNVGFVVTNLLSDETSLPVASVRAEQTRLDVVTADTTEVEVPSVGRLYFFIAEHRRLPDWEVTIQELRSDPTP